VFIHFFLNLASKSMNLKKLFFLAGVMMMIGPLSSYPGQKIFPEDVYQFLEDPGKFELNQEPGHTPLVPFSSVNDALANDWKNSWGYLSLNGDWKFHWAENPQAAPRDFYQMQFNDVSWRSILVPGNWEMQGYGDPVFRNIAQPFQADPPRIPHDYNPVGSYRKHFTLPANWKDKQVFLHFEAATSASFVWMNGQEVGFNEGANEPAEYNITPYLKPGDNLVAVSVYKYSAGSYLEDQDFWRLAGIFRDVYLLATPGVHLRDYFVTTDLDGDYRDAQLRIAAELSNYAASPASGYRVRAALWDKNKQPVLQGLQSDAASLASKETRTLQLSATVRNPDKWSSETPYLYTLTLELLDARGKAVEVLSGRIGFKKVEVRHQALYLNGVPIKLNGTNSHMQHPDLGHAMDRETIRKDLVLMKQFNINCVRTSHYPPTVDYLDLADELGMFLVDETGDESHATEYISERPEWTAAYVDRVRGMVLRDRNHPSILFWSAGNESGFGQNICEVIKEGKRLDPTRLFMYGGNTDDVGWRNEVPCEDIIGPRYATPFELRNRIAQVPESQDPRPSFMDEYVAATGNGAGGLDEYWEIIYRYPRIIGGAIWDWISPGLREKVRRLTDSSQHHLDVVLKGRGQWVPGKFGQAVELDGHDQWVDVYRAPDLDVAGSQLTLSLWVYPRTWNGDGTFLTKGSFQFGLRQSSPKEMEFYVTGADKTSIAAPVPSQWEGQWHHLAGIYDGQRLALYIDGALVASKPFAGDIANKPFPVNLGRNPELEGQEYPGNTSNARFDQVSIFDRAVPVEQLMNPSPALKEQALLWLDFEEVREEGEYFSMGIGGRSYGLIWPDRTPKPELWQVKKAAQPVHVEWRDTETGLVEVWNRYHFTSLDTLKTTWRLQADGKVLARGDLPLALAPLERKQIQIPFQKPALEPGVEYRLLVSFTLKEATSWAPAGFEVSWVQLELPWHVSAAAPMASATHPLVIEETTPQLSVSGRDFTYRFDKRTGRLSSLVYQGRSLLQEGPRLNVWRAPLVNELDPWANSGSHLTYRKTGMGEDPANSWRSLGLDHLTFKLDRLAVVRKELQSVMIEVEDHATGSSYSAGFDNRYRYQIEGSGELTIQHTVIPQGLMPAWLPRLGLQWIVNKDLKNVAWYGRGPFENYPDRKSGAQIGIYRSSVDEMLEHYLVPQDYGLRTDNRWVRLESGDGTGLEFRGSSLFNFNAHPYDTDNLTRARYPYQLRPFDGITFNFDYATSGVGCTAISVLNQYRVLPQMTSFTVKVRPYRNQ
jgi:beta-galactosidase